MCSRRKICCFALSINLNVLLYGKAFIYLSLGNLYFIVGIGCNFTVRIESIGLKKKPVIIYLGCVSFL